jgi:cephalosporin-C deacetylase-like acetyl esterase
LNSKAEEGILFPMNFLRFTAKSIALSCALLLAAQSVTAQSIKIRTDRENATYKSGETVRFQVRAEGFTETPDLTYVLKKGGWTEVGHGALSLTNNAAEISAQLDEPGTLLMEVRAKTPGGKGIRALGGAAFSPGEIQRSATRPDDFDAFWDAKIKELAATPIHAVLESVEANKSNLDYFKITMDGFRKSKIHGQLARPSGTKKLPALLIVQWAGVYPLNKDWACSPANEGFLVLNIEAHDLPIDEPESFYKQQSDGPLNDYTGIGNDSRETSYFLRMYLSAYRAAEYLTQRSDWDGKNLVVCGTSQGGLQTVMLAGLHPKITAAMANVPAGCDFSGDAVGRAPGWPQWNGKVGNKDKQKVIEAGRYFDCMNFAPHIKCPLLVSMGLIDETCPAGGVLSTINQTKGPREVLILPLSDHQGVGNTQAPMFSRMAQWRAAILAGKPLPPVQ